MFHYFSVGKPTHIYIHTAFSSGSTLKKIILCNFTTGKITFIYSVVASALFPLHKDHFILKTQLNWVAYSVV